MLALGFDVLPLLPLVFLTLGTIALAFGLLPRFKYVALIPLAATTLALFSLLWVAFNLPAAAILSDWAPTSLLPIDLRLQIDGLAWVYGVGILGITLATSLTGLARPGGRRVGTRGVVLLLALTGLLAVFSDNLPTRVLAWAALDAVYFLALLVLAEGDGLEPQAVLNLSFNSVGTLLAIGAAVLISRTSTSLSLQDAALTPQSTLIITLAAVFRLGLFPLHLGLPTEVNLRPGLGTMLRVLPAAVALEMLSRLVAFGATTTLQPWLTLFALAAVVVGGVQLWSIGDPRQGMAYVVIAQSGLALLAGLWAKTGAQALTAQALALMLGGALVFLSQGYDEKRPWTMALALAGGGAMAGLPLTIGFLGVGALYASLPQAGLGGWGLLLALVVAQAVLVAGLLHTCFAPGAGLRDDPLAVAAHWAGLIFLGLLVVLMAIFSGLFNTTPSSAPTGFLGFNGWESVVSVVWVLVSIGLGVALWRFEALVRATTEQWPNPFATWGRLDWLYRWVWAIIHATSSGVKNLAGLLEGEGAVLWTLVLALLGWLVFGR